MRTNVFPMKWNQSTASIMSRSVRSYWWGKSTSSGLESRHRKPSLLLTLPPVDHWYWLQSGTQYNERSVTVNEVPLSAPVWCHGSHVVTILLVTNIIALQVTRHILMSTLLGLFWSYRDIRLTLSQPPSNKWLTSHGRNFKTFGACLESVLIDMMRHSYC